MEFTGGPHSHVTVVTPADADADAVFLSVMVFSWGGGEMGMCVFSGVRLTPLVSSSMSSASRKPPLRVRTGFYVGW